MLLHTGVRASTLDDLENSLDDELNPPDTLDAPSSPPQPEAQGRLKMAASIKPFDASHFLSKIQNLTPATFDIVRDVRLNYAVPEGAQEPGVESDTYMTGLKRKADGITRSQYEVYSFATKHNLSEAAVNELLEMLGNVCTPHLCLHIKNNMH
jgi:hypothetical protein